MYKYQANDFDKCLHGETIYIHTEKTENLHQL